MMEGPDENKLQPLARRIVNLIDSFAAKNKLIKDGKLRS